MRYINICDIANKCFFSKNIIQSVINNFENVDRIYFGSYFCSANFCEMDFLYNLEELCKNDNIALTLVIPVFSEKWLQCGKNKIIDIFKILDPYIDEITVNDYGMLSYVRDAFDRKKINLGRLFFKDPRDYRVKKAYEGNIMPALLSFANDTDQLMNIYGIEIDKTNKKINITKEIIEKYDVRIHHPYCYMTTGNICKFASVSKNIEKKFRPNDYCNKECMSIFEEYIGKYSNEELSILRLGKAVYLKNEDYDEKEIEPIYFPIKEMIEALTEENEK